MSDLAIPLPDVIDPAFFIDPSATLKWLHATRPVYLYDPRPRYPDPMWILSRWEDVRFGQARPDIFSRRNGVMLEAMTRNPRYEKPDDPRFEVATRMSNFMDPPEHTRHRQLVRSHFHHKRIAKFETRVHEVVKDCFDSAQQHEVADLIPLLADRVPMTLIAELLGIDPAGYEQYAAWAATIFGSYEPGSTGTFDAIIEMLDFFEIEVADRRKQPRDDLVTALIEAEHNGARFEHAEVLLWCWIYLIAGQETTANLIAGGTRALLDHPDQRDRLVEAPDLIPNAIEEMLRWVTPTRYKMATVMVPTEVSGVLLAPGDKVYMSLLAGNRDPQIFTDPYKFDVARAEVSQHLSFNHGAHFCLGAPLARLEARAVFGALLSRFPKFARGGDIVTELSTVSNKIARLPVILSPNS